MNTRIRENPIVREIVERLARLGFTIIGASEDRIACGDLGKGELADVDAIIRSARYKTR